MDDPCVCGNYLSNVKNHVLYCDDCDIVCRGDDFCDCGNELIMLDLVGFD